MNVKIPSSKYINKLNIDKKNKTKQINKKKRTQWKQ